MIEALRIDGLAIVDHVELEFGPGLNVLTGETGAGKSIVLGALSLLAGRRASADGIRDGHDEAVVEALFRTDRVPELEAQLAERGFELEDHELVVRRTLARSGRSRARLAGQLVSASMLGEALAGAIEISSQHDSHALLRPETHGRLLDRNGGLLELREQVAGGYEQLRRLEDELAALRAEEQERERRRDFLSFQVQEIDDAELDSAEEEALRAERSRLAHAGRLRGDGAAALALLAGEPSGPDTAAAADLVADAAQRVEELAGLDPGLAPLSERLKSAESEVRDLAFDLERHLDAIEADPARLGVAEERLALIERLRRKYGASVEEVLRFRDEAAAELAAIEGAGEREAELERERDGLRTRLERDAGALTRGRSEASGGLAKVVESSLRELAMPQACFAVALDPAPRPDGLPCGPGGNEAPEFRFSANAGETPRALRKVASGGELSRAFLALKNALRESDAGMVLVFDEVDAGIGGRAADRVGRILAELAGHHQVLCITHLPQIAAFASTHLRVEKRKRKGRAEVRIERVEGDERVEEIARMAGGENVGEATRRHARELLATRADV